MADRQGSPDNVHPESKHDAQQYFHYCGPPCTPYDRLDKGPGRERHRPARQVEAADLENMK